MNLDLIAGNIKALALGFAGIVGAVILLVAVYYGGPIAVTYIKRIRHIVDGDGSIKLVLYTCGGLIVTFLVLFGIVGLYAFYTSIGGTAFANTFVGKALNVLAGIFGMSVQ